MDRFAESLGLPGAPKIKFLGKEIAKKKKNASRVVEALQAEIANEQIIKDAQSDDDLSSEEENSNEEDNAGSVESSADLELEDAPAKLEKVSPSFS